MVYFFDVESGSRFNQLSGHLGPVLDVCWAYDESLLATCDTEVSWAGLPREKPSVALRTLHAHIAAGNNNHMEKGQEQWQWKALSLQFR